jgi:hypothetical protein
MNKIKMHISKANSPNSLFAEMSAPDIEFPCVEGEKKREDNEKKETPTTQATNPSSQKRDIRLMRPTQRSPIFTEGRYLYIVSQWTVEARIRTNEEEDEEEEGAADG